MGVVYLRSNDETGRLVAEAWADRAAAGCAFHAGLEAALARVALDGTDFCELSKADGFLDPFAFWLGSPAPRGTEACL